MAIESFAKPVVIGYIPAFRALTATIDTTDLGLVTHINISFLNPDATGALIKNDTMLCMPDGAGTGIIARDLRYVVTKAHSAGVKVLVSVAGGVIPSCSGDWPVLLRPANRQVLVDGLIKFVDDFNLDGLDIDIEGDVLTKIDKAGNYTPFVQALSEQLKTRNKLLTCATASYEGGMIPVSSIPYFDFVNIMSYDLIGPSWGTPGAEHSTYAQAVIDVNLWKSRGLNSEKLVLGVPFYGYGFGTYATNYAFKEILAGLGAENSDKDLIGTACAGCSYLTYNGINTIKNKTRLALQQGAGIMIWELSQDASGSFSLLKTINAEIQIINSSSNNSESGAVNSASSLVSNSTSNGSVVTANDANQSKKSGGAFSLQTLLLLTLFGIIFHASLNRNLFNKKS
ncbi:MAG: glycosyl hydrolase family 18 [Moraxellaceae bacterium]|nr:MAG: glycosyl hydrolase family 18 [Moraxellaceae bacterium]